MRSLFICSVEAGDLSETWRDTDDWGPSQFKRVQMHLVSPPSVSPNVNVSGFQKVRCQEKFRNFLELNEGWDEVKIIFLIFLQLVFNVQTHLRNKNSLRPNWDPFSLRLWDLRPVCIIFPSPDLVICGTGIGVFLQFDINYKNRQTLKSETSSCW